jgi:hypothetical protein
MDFNFDGLPEPIRLPDEYLSISQYERVERHLANHRDEPNDVRFVREFLAALLGQPDFLSRTDDLQMSPHNLAQWEALNNHMVAVLGRSKQKGDPEIDKGLSGDPLAQTPEPK